MPRWTTVLTSLLMVLLGAPAASASEHRFSESLRVARTSPLRRRTGQPLRLHRPALKLRRLPA
jgi:hypothetical protein